MVSLGIVLAVTALYVAQAFFIPVAVSIMLTFLLGPVVTALQRRGLPQVPAVILIVVVAAVIVGAIGWGVTRQIPSLIADLPLYQSNIKPLTVCLVVLSKLLGTHGGRRGPNPAARYEKRTTSPAP